MIVTTTEPFTLEEIKQLRERFDTYIKTVIDVEKRICSAGMDRHFEGEQILLERGSSQADIWGGGLDWNTKVVDYNSFINIRSGQNNPSNEVLDSVLRDKYKNLTEYFFKNIL